MSNNLIQFRAEDTLKKEATLICEKLGLDLPSYLRMCLSRLVENNGIPFSMNVNDMYGMRALNAMNAIGPLSVESGVSDMTLDEINEEITKARNNAK